MLDLEGRSLNDHGKADMYIDNMTPVCVDIGSNVERCLTEVALKIDFMAQPLDRLDPLQ
jgi:hypothetical protein